MYFGSIYLDSEYDMFTLYNDGLVEQIKCQGKHDQQKKPLFKPQDFRWNSSVSRTGLSIRTNDDLLGLCTVQAAPVSLVNDTLPDRWMWVYDSMSIPDYYMDDAEDITQQVREGMADDSEESMLMVTIELAEQRGFNNVIVRPLPHSHNDTTGWNYLTDRKILGVRTA